MINKQNIWLIGMSGAGKSTVGKLLANRINTKFYDTDFLISNKFNQSINNIFREKGEAYFRNEEQVILNEILNESKSNDNNFNVIATGGGFVTNINNFELMQKNGIIIYLKIDVITATERLKQSEQRPLLANDKLSVLWETLLKKRVDIYEKADLIIPATNDAMWVCKEIETYLNNL